MRGGYRAGAGRPRGSKSSTRSLMKPIPTNIILVAAAQPPLRAADALGLLQAAYTNESLPEPVRLQAAAYALPYERAKPVTADGRSVEQIRQEVRQEIRRDGEDYRERLIKEIERHAAIHRQEREAALRRSMDEDTWDPGPMPQLLPPVRAPRPEARESEPPVIEAGPQPWPEASSGRNGQVVEPTRRGSLYTNPMIRDEPQPDRRPLSVQYRHLIRGY
jgi:hypothetical protein